MPFEVDRDYRLDEVPVERVTRVDGTPCTQYTELGSTVDLWDWRAEEYDIVYYPSNSTIPAFRTVRSPFHTTGVNINHLGFLTSGEPQEYEPADGWELLYLNLGTAISPAEEPSYGLYNRLDSRIRIFFFLEPNNGDVPDNVLIRLSQVRLNPRSKSTAVFENLNIPANALANFDKDVSIGGMVQLNAGASGSQWYMLEGVASYDPCLCQHESALAVEPILTDASSLTFTMDGTGTSSATYGAGSPISTLGYLNGLNGKLLSGYKRYKDLSGYKSDASSSTGRTIKMLSSVTSLLSGIGGVTDLLGFVLGKKTSTGEPKLTGFNHNFNFTANGALRDSAAYAPYYFTLRVLFTSKISCKHFVLFTTILLVSSPYSMLPW